MANFHLMFLLIHLENQGQVCTQIKETNFPHKNFSKKEFVHIIHLPPL